MVQQILDMGIFTPIITLKLIKFLNYFNPLKYIYFIESIFVKKIETKIFSSFDKILLFSKMR